MTGSPQYPGRGAEEGQSHKDNASHGDVPGTLDHGSFERASGLWSTHLTSDGKRPLGGVEQGSAMTLGLGVH